MTTTCFENIQIKGIKTVIPEHCVNIDDELEYFDDNPKKLARAKKMIGHGKRYIADQNTTVTDMATDAAVKLLQEMGISPDEIDLLIFVNQNPDYPRPSDACIVHGLLELNKSCTCLSINLGCSGYVHALMCASGLMSSGAFKTALLLTGDNPAHDIRVQNRKIAPVFGDAVSATILKYEKGAPKSFFVTGTDGKNWDKIIHPFGGQRLPYQKKDFDLSVVDGNGNIWTADQGLMKGEDVFNFTMEVAPQLLSDTMNAAGWTVQDVDLFAIHQANKQIVEMIVAKAGIPFEKAPTETFSRYANNSVNSVVTVLCDQAVGKTIGNTVLCTFGIGLSWGGAAVDLSEMYNGGISTYTVPKNGKTRSEQIMNWINYFKGEEHD